MSSLKYPFAEGTVKAIVEVYRMPSPMAGYGLMFSWLGLQFVLWALFGRPVR